MNKLALLVLALLASRSLPAASLEEQSIARVLGRRFSSPNISYLLLDARNGAVVASRWEDSKVPTPLGSLVKPFTALAYARRHGFRYPKFTCTGAAGGCWFPRGHGRIEIEQAIAFSCNAYFRALASEVRTEDVLLLIYDFGIHSLVDGLTGQALVGFGDQWRISPLEIARAYCELAKSGEAGVGSVLRGMALSAQAGTGSAVGHALAESKALVKTGTARCTHAHRAPGDGYVMVLYPADSPRVALLVRVHGVPGAQAAVVGGQMLRAAVEGK